MAKAEITAKPGVPQIVITREFDASPEFLFRAHVDPDLLAKWYGPRRLTLKVDRHEVRDAGSWRYIHQDADGNEFGFRGVFHGTPTVDGIVRTSEFEGAPGHVSLETLTFEPRGSKTLFRASAVFQSVEARDAQIQSGMESGVNDSMDRLDELVANPMVLR